MFFFKLSFLLTSLDILDTSIYHGIGHGIWHDEIRKSFVRMDYGDGVFGMFVCI